MHYNRKRSYGSVNYEPALRVVTELPPLTCVHPGCPEETRKRALCEAHAMRWDESHPRKLGLSDAQRLARLTLRTDKCWYWVGSLSEDYYANFTINGRKTRGHRAAWIVNHGDIPEGMQVDHLCHTTFCVRPDHLRLATPRQNSDHRRGANRGNKSGYRGVTWSPQMKMWQGRYMVQYVPYDVGYFEDPYEAHLAVEAARHDTKARLGLIDPDFDGEVAA